MAISNCLYSPTLNIPAGFLTWNVLVKLSAKPLIAETVGIHSFLNLLRKKMIFNYQFKSYYYQIRTHK
jgi:hypothetical protein